MTTPICIMNNGSITIIEILVLLAGLIGNAFLPKQALRYACWKQTKREKPEPESGKKELLLVTLAGELVYLALGVYWSLTYKEAIVILNTLFFGFALFGTYVDAKIRIIGNEMLKAMLVLVIVYKAVTYTSLKDLALSLAGFGFILGIFAAAAGLNYLHRGCMGVGMGDIKLAMIAGLLAGWPGVLDLLLGLAVALIGYILVVPMMFRKAGIHTPIKLSDHFAMCMSIMAGILYYLSRV